MTPNTSARTRIYVVHADMHIRHVSMFQRRNSFHRNRYGLTPIQCEELANRNNICANVVEDRTSEQCRLRLRKRVLDTLLNHCRRFFCADEEQHA